MNAQNCPRCGKLFSHISKSVCADCEKAEEETFNRLRDYLDEHPDSILSELSEATHISVKRITQYIRDGRLEITKGLQKEVGCERCGKPIRSGRYCDTCLLELSSQVNTLFGRDNEGGPAASHSNSSRMFTLGKSKRL
jgi:flagellar operon protein (TIGR03826 family)